MRISLILCFFLGLISCSSNSSKYEFVEASSSLDQARESIEAQKLTFHTPFEEGRKVWERALLFSEHFLAKAPTISNARTGTPIKSKFPETVLRTESERFSYEIIQRMEQDGFIYAVQSHEKSKGETPDSTLNAKNIARFLEKGQLEASLLVK